jgi:hypothetical protein
VKRSLVVEADGGLLGATLAGANAHDTKLLAATLEAIVVERPQPTEERPQHPTFRTSLRALGDFCVPPEAGTISL